MAVKYEWDIETVTDAETEDHEEGEVLDHNFRDNYREVAACLKEFPDAGEGQRFRVVIVRDDDEGRSWCYLDDGKLDAAFHDANGSRVAAVPKRFIAEVAKLSDKR